MNNFILEKRTTESIYYDLDCTGILEPTEIIETIISIEADQLGLVFDNWAVNSVPITFPDKTVGLAGKVISVQISGGIIPATQVNQLYTIRALFDTSTYNTREATVFLNVTNIPIQTGRSC